MSIPGGTHFRYVEPIHSHFQFWGRSISKNAGNTPNDFFKSFLTKLQNPLLRPEAVLGATQLCFRPQVKGQAASFRLALLGEIVKMEWRHFARPKPLHLSNLAARTPCGKPVKPGAPKPRYIPFQLSCRVRKRGITSRTSAVVEDFSGRPWLEYSRVSGEVKVTGQNEKLSQTA